MCSIQVAPGIRAPFLLFCLFTPGARKRAIVVAVAVNPRTTAFADRLFAQSRQGPVVPLPAAST